MADEKQQERQQQAAPKRTESETEARLRALEQSNTDLQLQLAQTRAGLPLSTIPENAAGVGDEVAETWSAYDQTLANAGEHPDQEPDKPK